jgi:hypothetical protein
MPDTGAFYHLAYVATGCIYTLYALTIYWRWRKVRLKGRASAH